jgi:acetoacetyl-CoA reductase/3-oxoacyl-[acyl-carrier protein] reductase
MASAAFSEVIAMDSLQQAGMDTVKLSVVSVPSSKPLTGKVALITGASRGIGRAIALELANRGATIAINCRSSLREAEDVKNEIDQLGATSSIFPGNVANKLEARRVVQNASEIFEHVDILVNNAGITRDRCLRKMTDEEWVDVIDTNLNSAFYCTRAALPAMIEQNYGRIVSMSSFVGQKGHFGQTNYAASKAGLVGFTKSLALEMAKYNITANVIAPGFVDTDMFHLIAPERMEQIKDEIPMRRLGKPSEIANAVAFLICDGNYITGQQINVNGGIYM